jgi:hypothetical protein
MLKWRIKSTLYACLIDRKCLQAVTKNLFIKMSLIKRVIRNVHMYKFINKIRIDVGCGDALHKNNDI